MFGTTSHQFAPPSFLPAKYICLLSGECAYIIIFLTLLCIVSTQLYCLTTASGVILGFGYEADFYCSTFWRSAPIFGNDSS